MRALVLVTILAGCYDSGGTLGAADVRGDYALVYGDKLDLALAIDGTLRRPVFTGGTINFGQYQGRALALDVDAFCARAGIVCPTETFGPRLLIDQKDVDRSQARYDIELYGGTGQYAGVVDHHAEDAFLAGAAGSTACRPLDDSVVTGRFTHRGETVNRAPMWETPDGGACMPTADGGGCRLDSAINGVTWPADAPVDGIADGRVTEAWLASCAFDAVPAGATLTFSASFTATRTGDFFTPDFDLAMPETD